MANCPECGTPIPEGHEKCPACGEIPMNLSANVTAHINLLKKKLAKDPSNTKLFVELGDLYYKHGFPREALNQYQNATKADASDYDAQIKSAHIFLQFRELEKSEHAFRNALHINPKSTDALIGLFRTYYLLERTTEAIVLGEKIVHLRPDSVEFHMLLKNLYHRKGDTEKTMHELHKLIALVPNNEQVVKELALLYKKENNIEKLAEYYDKMQDMRIEDIELGVHIVQHYFEKNDYDRVFKHGMALLEKESMPPDTRTLIRSYLARAYFITGNITEAKLQIDHVQPEQIASLEKKIQKELAVLYYEISQKEISHNKKKKAINYLELAVTADTDNAEYMQTLDKIKNEMAVSSRKILRKITVIGGGVLGACVIIVVAWLLLRNRIIIHVEPAEDIVVLIDGQLVEPEPDKPGVIVSPVLFIGKHDIEIDRAGFETWQHSVSIGIGRPTKVEVKLSPMYLFLRIASEPESASVFVDGQLAGKTPFISPQITAAPHVIEVAQLGYKTWRHTLVDMTSDSIDLGVVVLKNLAGTWRGKIGDDSYAYTASFSMTIEQDNENLTIKYSHGPRENHRYSGTIKGRIENDDFYAEGNVTYRYLKVFYWAEERQKIIMRGTMSDTWERIEGKHSIGSMAEQEWWAEISPE